MTSPLVEEMPRYDGPESIFYYEQEDDMFAIQKRRQTWSYNIIRPMGIIGYFPINVGHPKCFRYYVADAMNY